MAARNPVKVVRPSDGPASSTTPVRPTTALKRPGPVPPLGEEQENVAVHKTDVSSTLHLL